MKYRDAVMGKLLCKFVSITIYVSFITETRTLLQYKIFLTNFYNKPIFRWSGCCGCCGLCRLFAGSIGYWCVKNARYPNAEETEEPKTYTGREIYCENSKIFAKMHKNILKLNFWRKNSKILIIFFKNCSKKLKFFKNATITLKNFCRKAWNGTMLAWTSRWIRSKMWRKMETWLRSHFLMRTTMRALTMEKGNGRFFILGFF